MEPLLTLHLFGAPQISYKGTAVKGFDSNKTRALLIYLAVTGRPHSRDALAHLFWANNASTARTNLRKALSNLRKLDGISFTEPTPGTIAIESSLLWTDVAIVEHVANQNELSQCDLYEATNLYKADFLADFNVSVSHEFEEWAFNERTRLKRQVISLLERLIELCEEANEVPQAIGQAQRILDIEPWREETHRHLMRLFMLTDSRSAALAQYDQCVAILKKELDIGPSPETQALYGSIRSNRFSDTESSARNKSSNAPAAKPAPSKNLPFPATPLVGRQQILTDIEAMLQRDEVRLLTLTGPGGVGKTRLAIETGRNLAARYADGAVFVELAAIQAEALVPVAIADALGIRESAGNTPWLEHIANHLEEKSLLLIVDNFEHVINSAIFISALLSQTQKLNTLITSREVLNIQGEFQFDTPPLDLPSNESKADYDKIEDIGAIQLFIQRARAVNPSFTVDEITLQHISEICKRLDGLPLAIELAAVRAKILDVASIFERLKQRFVFLKYSPRNVPERHQTLQGAIDWSYSQLTKGEQAMFRLLSTFVGGSTLDSITHVYSDVNGSNDQVDVINSLVDKSLLTSQISTVTGTRFTQLETIIQYGRIKALEAREWNALKNAHAVYFVGLAEEAEPMLFSAQQDIWLERLGNEHDNLRAALMFLIESGKGTVAAQLGFALWHFWYIRSHYVEGSAWLEQILEMNLPIASRAKVSYGLGMLARKRFDDASVIKRLQYALTLFRQIEDDYFIASTLRVLGFTEYRSHKYVAAEKLLQEALTIFRDIDNIEGIAATLSNLGYVHMRTESYVTGGVYIKESLDLRRQTGNMHGIANCLDSLSLVAIRQGEYTEAKICLRESTKIYISLGNPYSSPYSMMGWVNYLEGDYVEAHKRFEQAYSAAIETQNTTQMATAQVYMALTSIRFSTYEKALILVSDALTHHKKLGQENVLLVLAAASQIMIATNRLDDGLRVSINVLRISNEQKRVHPLLPTEIHQLELMLDQKRNKSDPFNINKFDQQTSLTSLDDILNYVIELRPLHELR